MKHSVSHWISTLREGDAEAAQQLWNRYSSELVELARRRLGDAPKRIADEEDIAISVFRSLCRGAQAGRFDDIEDRDDLWWLLLYITKQKTVDYKRRETAQKRGSGHVRTEAELVKSSQCGEALLLDQLIGSMPTPEFIVSLEEQNRRLLDLLRDDILRQIAISRLEGFSISEIAEDRGVSTRTIERKLQLIRSAWSEELTCVD